jgi:hypothetical protein
VSSSIVSPRNLKYSVTPKIAGRMTRLVTLYEAENDPVFGKFFPDTCRELTEKRTNKMNEEKSLRFVIGTGFVCVLGLICLWFVTSKNQSNKDPFFETNEFDVVVKSMANAKDAKSDKEKAIAYWEFARANVNKQSSNVECTMDLKQSPFDWSSIRCESNLDRDMKSLGIIAAGEADRIPWGPLRTKGKNGLQFGRESDEDELLTWQVSQQSTDGKNVVEIRFRMKD